MADVKIQPAGDPVDPPPKLTTTGQALQSALDLVGRGGERSVIEGQINQQVMSARQSGDETTANALQALLSNYHLASVSEAATGSNTEGFAYLGNVQRDITAGKYNETAPAAAAPAPATSPQQSAINAATNRYAAAVAGGNPQAIAVAERDLNELKVESVKTRTTTTTTTTVSAPHAAPVSTGAPTDALAYARAFRKEIQALDGATVTVNTVTDDEILRRYRARA